MDFELVPHHEVEASVKTDKHGCEVYESGDPIWISIDNVTYPGNVTDPRDGYELEIVTPFGATTAHVTELRPR
jgi:hypothetical protein